MICTLNETQRKSFLKPSLPICAPQYPKWKEQCISNEPQCLSCCLSSLNSGLKTLLRVDLAALPVIIGTHNRTYWHPHISPPPSTLPRLLVANICDCPGQHTELVPRARRKCCRVSAPESGPQTMTNCWWRNTPVSSSHQQDNSATWSIFSRRPWAWSPGAHDGPCLLSHAAMAPSLLF